MEQYNGILCISGAELILSDRNPAGLMTKHCYDKLVNRKRINVLSPGKGKPALIEFNSLPEKYRQAVREKSEVDLDALAQKEDLMKRIKPDRKAVDFFKTYTLAYDDNTKGIPESKQLEYVNNACILNAIGEAYREHASARKRQAKRPLSEFWDNTSVAIRHLPDEYAHSLPSHPRRLHEKLREYTRESYACLVSKKFTNSNTLKITPEAGEWIVARYMSMIDRVTIVQLHEEYNRMSKARGWKPLKTFVTIRDYLNRPEVERIWYAARYGELKAKEKFQRQNRTLLPTRRDSLWYSDGTKLNYYYQDEKGETRTCNVYEVIDVYSEMLLGYHISDREDFEAQYNAYRMAVQTSGYKPYEIRYDNQGGHKKLENSDFLKNLARHAIRTAPYNGKSKTIENLFYRFQSRFLHKDWFFTGQNITAKSDESRVNIEFTLANTKRLPSLDEVKETYRQRREEWNNTPHPSTEISRAEMYRAGVNGETTKVSIPDMLDMFGVTTQMPSTYTSAGIEIQVKKKVYAYEVLLPDGEPDRAFNRRNVGRRFYTRYQPDDMNCVLLYEKDTKGDMRFIALAQKYAYVNRAMQDQRHDDLSLIRLNEHANKAERIAEERNRNAILEKHGLHPNQHGLNVAPLKGISTRKKKLDVGDIQKEVSNITAVEAETRKQQKAVRDAERQAAKDREAHDREQRDFSRRRRALLEMNVN